ncbi:uncharacterized protein LOC132608852 isoform X1 [Lycium barbarum]|uniref:uncharacterized protein LOC132608852 isoform X1 n=1 Tax=Lycium barbarum TaxID=112863 RepID=UPI00293ED4DC|nr:uncharacterized protein LOC132608852 isoform X1 [Lycium barbarum]
MMKTNTMDLSISICSRPGEEVLPLCASPRSLFLGTWTFFSQSFDAVVSSFKKFRWAVSGFGVAGRAGRFIYGNDLWWFLFSYVPWSCMFFALLKFTGARHVYNILMVLDIIIFPVSSITHSVVVYSVVYWYRDMPFRLMGAKAKFMIEVIPMIMAVTLHHLLEFNYGYLELLLGFTTYFYIFAHFTRIAYDIGVKDILVGLVMQVLGYMLNVELLVRALALSFCLGYSFYRYVTYCAPEVPVHSKKELEQLPC